MTRIIPLDDSTIKHHFGAKEYIKETFSEAGVELAQHKHKHSHLSVLMQGKAAVTVEGETTVYEAPKILEIKAGKYHNVKAITDVIWLCVWGVDPEFCENGIVDDGLIE